MNKRGQIWVETVIYTLIGITIIGIVLGVAKPKIDEKRDELAIEQAIESLDKINSKIIEVSTIAGNRRIAIVKIGKGELVINGAEDVISWELPVSFEYSEVSIPIQVGDLNITTTQRGSEFSVLIEKKFNSDILYNEGNGIQPFSTTPTPYNLIIENKGRPPTPNSKVMINIREA